MIILKDIKPSNGEPDYTNEFARAMQDNKERMVVYFNELETTVNTNNDTIEAKFATGLTEDVAVAKVGGGTRTFQIVDGLITGYTDSSLPDTNYLEWS